MGIKGAYVPFRVAPGDVGQALQSLRILNIAGANVTVPYKETVVPHMDILSEGANIIGAINTIVRNGTELKGYNTNAIGFMDALLGADYEVEGRTAAPRTRAGEQLDPIPWEELADQLAEQVSRIIGRPMDPALAHASSSLMAKQFTPTSVRP